MRAGHIVEERNGRARDRQPKEARGLMREFRHGDLQVLLCGIPAIRLGHNLDTASVVVVDGLVFSYEMFDQFIARAHRLSSKQARHRVRDAHEGLARREEVGAALRQGSRGGSRARRPAHGRARGADLAGEGAQGSPGRGVPLTGEEIAEAELRAAWETTATVIPLIPRRKPFASLEPLVDIEQLELFAA